MNIMLNDAMLGVASLIWGFGVLDTRLSGVSETGELNGFCTQWPIFRENAVKKSFVTSSIPLTFDRFFSIVLPDQVQKCSYFAKLLFGSNADFLISELSH